MPDDPITTYIKNKEKNYLPIVHTNDMLMYSIYLKLKILINAYGLT